MNIWRHQLIRQKHEIRAGFYRVPESPGLGVQIDQAAMRRYRVPYATIETPRHLYKYVRANGEFTIYACDRHALHQVYPADSQPISESGSTTEIIPDDGSRRFRELYREAIKAPVKEKARKPTPR